MRRTTQGLLAAAIASLIVLLALALLGTQSAQAQEPMPKKPTLVKSEGNFPSHKFEMVDCAKAGFAAGQSKANNTGLVFRAVSARHVIITADPQFAQVAVTDLYVVPSIPVPVCGGVFVAHLQFSSPVTLTASTKLEVVVLPHGDGELVEFVFSDLVNGLPVSGLVGYTIDTPWDMPQHLLVRGADWAAIYEFPELRQIFLPLVAQRLEWEAVREQCMLPEGCPTATPAPPKR